MKNRYGGHTVGRKSTPVEFSFVIQSAEAYAFRHTNTHAHAHARVHLAHALFEPLLINFQTYYFVICYTRSGGAGGGGTGNAESRARHAGLVGWWASTLMMPMTTKDDSSGSSGGIRMFAYTCMRTDRGSPKYSV